jgi:8-oxo-dGTP pyrophosphatase MutT (NUDIX family)/GNAT superfamily N-acetyltransferase
VVVDEYKWRTAYGGAMPDLRRLVRDAVATRRPVDARERSSIAEFVRILDELAEPFDEHADRRHVTGSAIVISDDGRRVLLHRHKRLGLWLQPGGHIDPGELPWDAAAREAVEEGGLPATLTSSDLVHVDVHPGPRGHTHLDLRYLVGAPRLTPAPGEGESQDVQWFAWHQAIDLAEEGLEGVLRALQPGEPKVRQARHTDARGCADVFLRSRAFALDTVPVVHDEPDVRRWMGDEVVGRTDMWVAEVDGTIVGLMVLEPDRDPGTGWINHLYLDPSWIGRGLGERFVAVAKERHPAGLQLWTFQVNDPARRFYARHGFVEAETTDGRGNEERTPDVRLTWSGRTPS